MLKPSDTNETGYRHVPFSNILTKPYQASISHGTLRPEHLGYFVTVEEAALAVARFLEPQQQEQRVRKRPRAEGGGALDGGPAERGRERRRVRVRRRRRGDRRRRRRHRRAPDAGTAEDGAGGGSGAGAPARAAPPPRLPAPFPALPPMPAPGSTDALIEGVSALLEATDRLMCEERRAATARALSSKNPTPLAVSSGMLPAPLAQGSYNVATGPMIAASIAADRWPGPYPEMPPGYYH